MAIDIIKIIKEEIAPLYNSFFDKEYSLNGMERYVFDDEQTKRMLLWASVCRYLYGDYFREFDEKIFQYLEINKKKLFSYYNAVEFFSRNDNYKAVVQPVFSEHEHFKDENGIMKCRIYTRQVNNYIVPQSLFYDESCLKIRRLLIEKKKHADELDVNKIDFNFLNNNSGYIFSVFSYYDDEKFFSLRCNFN